LTCFRYFQRPLNIYCEFIPQVIFLFSLFGYLVLLVFSKWVWFDADMAACAPSILITLINMVLMKDGEVAGCEGSKGQFYAGQGGIEKLLVFAAFVSVPWMLAVKPYLLFKQNKAKVMARANVSEFRFIRALDPFQFFFLATKCRENSLAFNTKKELLE
jgi:V-type H+-transporting ATPase subunit a